MTFTTNIDPNTERAAHTFIAKVSARYDMQARFCLAAERVIPTAPIAMPTLP